ncbi:hypothetical protein [Caballeronia grimmiae]|uniref:hypothetical protein n=1 Tax=Caballeronia grimmiae TaxID=1071679 RepID=UPI0038B712B5
MKPGKRFGLLAGALMVSLTWFAPSMGDISEYRNDDDRHIDHLERLPVAKVLDSRGAVAGPLVSVVGGNAATIDVDGVLIVVPINRMRDSAGRLSASQYQWRDNGQQFSTSDCSGPPVISPTEVLRPAAVVRRGADVTLYVAADAYVGPIEIRSYSDGQGQCTTRSFSYQTIAWSADKSFALTQRFPEPLSIKFERPAHRQ